MNLVTIDSVYTNEEHKTLMNGLSPAAKDVVENILYENKEIRADVLDTIANLEVGDYAVYYSDFLSNTRISPEWYPIIDRVYKEHEETDYSEYLAALSDAFDQWILERNVLADDVERIYNSSENCFKFRKGLETLKNKKESQAALEENVPGNIITEDSETELEEVSEKFSDARKLNESDFCIDKKLQEILHRKILFRKADGKKKKKIYLNCYAKELLPLMMKGI